MKTRAIILAAGRGSRMGEITSNSHKCLTKLLGKPLLQWQIEAMEKAGIKDITVVRGYNSHLLNGNFNTVENNRWAETNMVGSLFNAPPFDGKTIISYSDIVYKPEYVSKLINSNEDISVVADLKWKDLWERRFDNPLDDAETFQSSDGKLINIGGKTVNMDEIQGQYLGLMGVNKKGWETLYHKYKKYDNEEQDKKDMTGLLSDLLKEKVEIAVKFVEGGWCEVDSYNDLMVYEEAINHGSDWLHDWRD